MKLDVIIDDQTHRIDVPPEVLNEAEDFFRKMDLDMDAGWQMGPEFVENPDAANRCRIAANKLLTSHASQNRLVMQLMAGYILNRMPGIKAVNIDTGGEMLNTELIFEEGARHVERPATDARLTEAEARARADQDVSQVYRVGKAWRFAVLDRATGRWMESPFTDSEEQAVRMRDAAHAKLVEKLVHG